MLKETDAAAARAGIAFEGITQYFLVDQNGSQKAIEALANVSLSIAPQEFIALVGPSGCGKTTLLNIAAGAHIPQEGRVAIDGSAPKLGRPDVVYMLARDALLPWRTAIQNVEYGLELRGMEKQERKSRAKEILQAVGLNGFENAYRSQLSHGMRQRVALARTFVMPSPVLLMDEPFGALDVHLKIQLGDLLLNLWERDKRTVLFVTHDLHEAIALADRVVVMQPRPGRIVADIEIPLSRPRSLQALQTDRQYHDLYSHIWSLLTHA